MSLISTDTPGLATMLAEDPEKRPNIYQVLSKVCTMRDKAVPIKDVSMIPFR